MTDSAAFKAAQKSALAKSDDDFGETDHRHGELDQLYGEFSVHGASCKCAAPSTVEISTVPPRKEKDAERRL